MPAIQLTRLRLQAAHLRDSYSRPEAFVRGLQAMLEYYADRTHRSGQSGEPPPLITAYHVAPPVLRQILLELKPLINQEPGNGMLLAESLWAKQNLECRMLAASILGLLPADYSEQTIQHIEGWAKAEKEDKLLESLLDQGLQNIRREQPARFFSLVERWLNSENLHEQSMGLKALPAMLEDGPFEHLPVLFRMLTSLTRASPPVLRPDLLAVLNSAARHSPPECAYFLRQTLASPQSLDTPWLTRQLLPEFPPEIQQALRETLRQMGR
jgi:hypothetical protein